jgi:hypothetical protein
MKQREDGHKHNKHIFISNWESHYAKHYSLLTFFITGTSTPVHGRCIQRLIREGGAGFREPIGERKSRRWLLPARIAAVEVIIVHQYPYMLVGLVRVRAYMYQLHTS